MVINEIMYHPVETRNAGNEAFEARPGEYIELFNRSPRTVALEGFRFTQGIQFTFPAGAALAPGGYVVVAQDPAYMGSVYGLNGVLGPWQGSLQNDGETIRLEDPMGNVANEIRYADGGDWSELADGQGSSLELADPRADNSAGTAWEASDESHKAAWTQLTYTGTYADLAGGEDLFRFTPMQAGSFLLDDVEILRGTTPLISEPGFEGGTSGWLMEGTLVHSARTTEEAHTGGACLKVVATDRGDLRVNRLAVILQLPMTPGTYTVRFWARWLHGGNMILAHGFDNDMARALWLPVPRELGTPGRENSATARLRAEIGSVNAGPVIKDAAQSPARPRPGEGVTVSVTASDADGVASVKVLYRASRRDGPFTPLDMTLASSPSASSGRYAASLPGFAEGTKVLYYIEAMDSTGRVRRYPGAAPERTLLFQTGQARGGPLIHYSLILDDDRQDELESRSIQSDDPLFGAFTFDDRETYQDVGVHYHGSPWERPGTPRSFKITFPGDHSLHGAKRFNISRYGSSLNEGTAYYTLGRNGGSAPAPHGRYEYVQWDVNGSDEGIMGRVETVDGAYVKRWFRGDDDGPLFRTNGQITSRKDESWSLTRWASLEDLGSQKELYRWAWDLHTRELEDDWSPLLALMRLMDASTTPSGAQFETLAAKVFDVDEAVRILSVRALNDDWDSVGFGNGQNAYLYFAPREGRWKFIPWDMDGTFGNTSARLLPDVDPGLARLVSRPRYLRLYLQAQRRSLATTWSEQGLSRFLSPNSSAGVGNEDQILGFVRSRRPDALAFTDRPATFRILTHGGSDFAVPAESVTLDGEAPLAARFILTAGSALEPEWTKVTSWKLTLPLIPGDNRFDLAALDDDGVLVGSATITVTSTVSWPPPSLSDLEPSSGPDAGGTRVRIHGADFQRGAVVRFGSALAAVESVAGSEIQAVTPPGAGTVQVTVTNLDGKFTTLPAGFTYTRPRFVRGDASGDGAVTLTDVFAILDHLFRGGVLDCQSAADANDDGEVDLGDPIRLLFHLFVSGGPLPPPGPAAGPDPTPDGLPCARSGD